MGLTPGTKLGPCQSPSPLGACGTGEVYRARDARLKLEVAWLGFIRDVRAAFPGHPGSETTVRGVGYFGIDAGRGEAQPDGLH